jgi:hypothetical protein
VTAEALHERGIARLGCSWDAYARGSRGAAVVSAGAAAAFPSEPGRSVYDNVVPGRGLGRAVSPARRGSGAGGPAPSASATAPPS